MPEETGPPPQKKKTRRWIWISAILLLAGALALGVWGWFRFRVWPEETRRILETKNLALGYLENEQFDECNPLLERLARELPNELLPARNLAISRLLLLKGIGPTQFPERFAQAKKDAEAALDHLKEMEGETADVQILSGKLAEYSQENEAQIDAYAQAARLDPDNAVAWGELFLAARASHDPIRQIQAREALKKAYSLEPDNLFLLLEMLSQQASRRDPEIADTLNNARQVLAPFAEAIQRRNRGDIFQYIDQAIEALHQNEEQPPEWEKVTSQVRILSNVIRPENAQQRDRKRIERYELEYLIADFSPEFYASAYLPNSFDSPPIDVTFKKMETPSVFDQLANVRFARFLDFDLDGRLDVLVATDSALTIFGRNDAGGWQELATLDLPKGVKGVLAADLDRDHAEVPTKFEVVNVPGGHQVQPGKICLDADPELCVYGEFGLLIVKNVLDHETGSRSLEIVPQVEAFRQQSNIVAAAFLDLDQDGDLDLAASGDSGVSLWLNLDNDLSAEGFTEITSRSGMPPEDFRPSTMIAVDWDRNISVDLILIDDERETAGWLENLHHGRFRWIPFDDAFSEVNRAKTAALIDADANASWDLLTAGDNELSVVLTQTPTSGVVRFQESKSIDEANTDGIETLDYDNDGLMDFLIWNSDGVSMFHARDNAEFESVDLFDEAPMQTAGADAGDLDGDGDLDLLFFGPRGVAFYDNQGGNQNRWIDLALRADQNPQYPAERSNMQGIGSLLEVKAGPRYQAQVVTDSVTHFGLGQIETPDLVRVVWTNGIPENVIQPPTNTLICDRQQLKGSCPYLYVWNGERFEFYTDLLWAAPIGLQWAEHVLAPAREWEYLLIEGDKLQPKDGEYHLQITEELWEAAYFDHVELIAVDHPADVEIHSNEKVGPAELAEPKLHAVKHPRVPIAARDQNGRDVLNKIARRDEDYLRAYDDRIKQGLTEEHFLELELGELENPKTITLFLTGWVFPTDTSLNIAIDQNPTASPPRPPYLMVPDENGDWREAVPYIGFPGGKTKTIAVEVPASLFNGNDYRLRIATSMQINWDQVFFTVDADKPEFDQTPLKLIDAELHFRGYSEVIPHPQNGPDRYDYLSVSTEPRWPPMEGRFTRFGDVAELVKSADDRLVVMGAGDEMTLKFEAPPPPPAGWKRSFLLHSVGWDKDADLNTVHGETVEPLPFRGMDRYPYEPDQAAPDSQTYRDYLKTCQTREQSSARFWKRLKLPRGK